MVFASSAGCRQTEAERSLLYLKSPGGDAKKGGNKAKCEGEEGQEFLLPCSCRKSPGWWGTGGCDAGAHPQSQRLVGKGQVFG